MAEHTNNRSESFAWGLLLLGLLVAAAVLSHDPARPLASGVYPAESGTGNLLGLPGEWLAGALFDALGTAVYVLLAAWLAAVVLLLLGRPALTSVPRLCGWCVLVPAAAVLLDVAAPAQAAAARCGAGGSLGAWLHLWLAGTLTVPGFWLVAASVTALGVLLAFDATLAYLSCAVSRWCAALGKFLSRLRPARTARPTPPRPKKVKKVNKPKPMPAGALPEPDEPALDIDEIPIRRPDSTDLPAPAALAQEEPEADAPSPVLLPISRPGVPQGDEWGAYELPGLSLLEDPEPFPYEQHEQKLRERAVQLEKTFRDFDLNVRVVGINTGPVITQYELALETGLRVHKVTGLADDIALNLMVANVRMVAPIPGKNTVGVEVPNDHRAVVRIKEVMLGGAKQAARAKIPLYLGKDVEGRPLVQDLADMPHLLIAGRTGTGKSVCLNSVILSLLMNRRPDEVKLLMIDPKGNEFTEYGQLPHLMHPVVTDMKKAEGILAWAVDKMEQRYELLGRARVRNIASYNELGIDKIVQRVKPAGEERDQIPEKLPYIVIIIDEMADLMMTMKREVEGHIIRLAQKSRAAGIHLVVATQKPTVDVITGLIKSNLPARICFQVASRSDSRVVLDEMGADKLLGKGDMLFLQPGTSTILRAQGTYASDEEITRVVEALEGEPEYAEELLRIGTEEAEGGEGLGEGFRGRDDLYEQAIEIVVREGRGSVSLLQRALGIGYGRAARLIDFMAEDGIVGTYRGSSAREVNFTVEEWQQMKRGGAPAAAAAGS